MKKIVALILLIAMIACALVGCKEEQTQDPSNGTETGGSSSYLDGLGAKNFAKKSFRVLDANDHAYMHVNFATLETKGDSVINEALYERDEYLIERYNLSDIEYFSSDSAGVGCEQIRTQVNSNGLEYDMIISTAIGGENGTLASLALQGYLQNLNGLNYLSLNSAWWSRLIYQNLTLNGCLYFTTGDIAPSVYQSPAAMFVNMDLLEKYYPDLDIFALVENYEWTLDKLLTLSSGLSSDVNDDSKMTAIHDFFGITAQKSALPIKNFIYGAGFTLANNNGESLSVNYSNELLSGIMDKLMVIYPDNYSYTGVGGGNKAEEQQLVITSTFMESRALFLQHMLESAMYHLRSMEADYGILPFPLYSDQQRQYYSLINNWCTCFVAVPVQVADDRMDMTSFMMEATSAYSYEILRPLVYERVLKLQRARDPQSSKMVDVILDGITLDFATVYNIGDVDNMIYQTMYKDTSWSGQQIGNRGPINKSIADILKAHGK